MLVFEFDSQERLRVHEVFTEGMCDLITRQYLMRLDEMVHDALARASDCGYCYHSPRYLPSAFSLRLNSFQWKIEIVWYRWDIISRRI